MVPALVGVCKSGLPIPADALRLVGQFLRKRTPSAAIVLETAREKDFNRDICRWLIFKGLQQVGKGGFGRFVTGPAFQIDFLSRLQVFSLKHRKLKYTESFCGYCHMQFLDRWQCERCFRW